MPAKNKVSYSILVKKIKLTDSKIKVKGAYLSLNDM
jgi:hypothetical protein